MDDVWCLALLSVSFAGLAGLVVLCDRIVRDGSDADLPGGRGAQTEVTQR
jgi:hypothetical protein